MEQLAKWSLPKPEVRRLNPAICKKTSSSVIFEFIFASIAKKGQTNRKKDGNDLFYKYLSLFIVSNWFEVDVDVSLFEMILLSCLVTISDGFIGANIGVGHWHSNKYKTINRNGILQTLCTLVGLSQSYFKEISVVLHLRYEAV